MNNRKLTIGQMADINHVSRQTLRHYDNEGLLVPSEVDEQTGYRYYNIMQSARLDMIQYMKSLGISLRDIKTHMDSRDIGSIVELLRQKQLDVDSEIERLHQQKRAIRRMVESIQRYESAPPDGTILLEYIGERSIFCHDTKINFYLGGIELYEQMLRRLKDQMRGHQLPEIFFYNAGTILREERLQRREFYSTEVFVFMDRDFADPALLTRLPAAPHYCIYCHDFEREKEYAQRLLDYVQQSGLRICGDYICEVLFEPPVSSNASRAMLMRLQVPISFR